jgi:ankyrin repeat protein
LDLDIYQKLLANNNEACKEVASRLLGKFPSKMECRKNDKDFLFLAVENKNTFLVEAIIQSGKYIDIGKKKKNYLFYFYTSFFLKKLDTSGTSYDNQSALIESARNSSFDILACFLKKGGFSVDKKDSENRTVFHWFALNAGTDVDPQMFIQLINFQSCPTTRF